MWKAMRNHGKILSRKMSCPDVHFRKLTGSLERVGWRELPQEAGRQKADAKDRYMQRT